MTAAHILTHERRAHPRHRVIKRVKAVFNDNRSVFDWVSDERKASGGTYLLFGFGSWHNEVVHFAFADGSCRPIAKNVDAALMMAFSTRNGNERISQED